MKRLLLTGVFMALAPPLAAQTLSFPPQAERRSESRPEAGTVPLATGAWTEAEGVPLLRPEGAVRREVWQLPATAATGEIIAALRGQLEEGGWEVLLSCAGEACGGFDFRFALKVAPPPEMYVALGDFRYLSARREVGGAPRYVSLLVSRTEERGYVQVTRFGGTEEADLGSVVPAAAPDFAGEGEVGPLLEAQGHVVLSDLSFESGSAQLGEGPFDSLAGLAAYLAAAPERRIALVGHTDTEGGLEPNIELSRRRARAVQERLVTAHAVRPAQLEADGTGYLAPLASNLTAEGREANRRVEAVLVR